ncbi:MAG: hypothetical protein EPN68_16920 [Rhodanobacter sp.]|nr:MAG: hypothetical protein EPN68_16920 [Rhodanobacter sp.]
MLTQYVFPSKLGLFRIVQHGRRWRALHDRVECGRHDSAEIALATLRNTWPQARLPISLDAWRCPSKPSFARASCTPLPRWCTAY